MARFWPAPGGGGGASVTVSAIAPEEPADGDLWFDSSNLSMYIYYNDGNSSQWVQVGGADSASAEFSQMLLPGM